MDKRATETAEFLKFFDTVFDSVNGHSLFDAGGKTLKRNINLLLENNIHVEFWKSAIKTISTMYTIDKAGKKKIPPTFQNWVFTLKNFIILLSVLKSVGFKQVSPRFLNQDPLENFFGKIRQRGVRFTNPTCTSFVNFYKSLLVNNLIGKQSVGANCEEDNCDILLTLKKFLSTDCLSVHYFVFMQIYVFTYVHFFTA